MQILFHLWKWYVNLFLFTYRMEWNRFSYFEFYWYLFGWSGAIQFYKDEIKHLQVRLPLGFMYITIHEYYSPLHTTELIIQVRNILYPYILWRR